MRRTLLASVLTTAVVLAPLLASASASTKVAYTVQVAKSASSRPNTRAHACGSGFLHVVDRGKHVCRAAPDLRVAVTSTPSANRVGGTITFAITVRNAGRAVARRVVLAALAPAEYVSASSSVGACSSPAGVLRTTCALGSLRPSARATASVSTSDRAWNPSAQCARIVGHAGCEGARRLDSERGSHHRTGLRSGVGPTSAVRHYWAAARDLR